MGYSFSHPLTRARNLPLVGVCVNRIGTEQMLRDAGLRIDWPDASHILATRSV